MKGLHLLTLTMTLTLHAAAPLIVPAADVVDDYAQGRAGEALKTTLYRHCRPTTLYPFLPETVIDLLEHDGSVTDMLSGLPLPAFDDAVAITYAVPPQWMKLNSEYADAAANDLHNALLTSVPAAYDRGILPFAPSANGPALPGSTVVGGTDIDCFNPPDELKGDIARKIFYMATIYPCEFWSSWGRNIFDNSPYPTLRKGWSDIYMHWHTTDPVDDTERLTDRKISQLQGNTNPFVSHPELASYLWGEMAGEVYKPATTSPADVKKSPLRKVYTQSDVAVWLYSPYIPEDVSWTVDGVAVAGDRIMVKDLSYGFHEVRYSSPRSGGKLLIEITP